MNLCTLTDDRLRTLAQSGDARAISELAKRGLTATPETIEELRKSRKIYNNYAQNSDGDWGYTAKYRRFER